MASLYRLRSRSFKKLEALLGNDSIEKKSGGNMKFRISLFLLTLALAASSTLTAHASACSNSTIQGAYAFTIHGTLFLPDGSALVIDGIDRVTFDGKGNFTQV